MTERTTIGATFPRHALARVAFDLLPGASPGMALRYLAYRAAGHADASEKVMPKPVPLSDFDSRVTFERTNVPREVVAEIQHRFPGKSIPWALRFQYAKDCGANDEQAAQLAEGFKSSGRPKGSKDSKPRVRRTKQELANTA